MEEQAAKIMVLLLYSTKKASNIHLMLFLNG